MMEIDWDKIVVFDRRYVEEIFSVYGRGVEEKIVEIPYPCLSSMSSRLGQSP